MRVLTGLLTGLLTWVRTWRSRPLDEAGAHGEQVVAGVPLERTPDQRRLVPRPDALDEAEQRGHVVVGQPPVEHAPLAVVDHVQVHLADVGEGHPVELLGGGGRVRVHVRPALRAGCRRRGRRDTTGERSAGAGCDRSRRSGRHWRSGRRRRWRCLRRCPCCVLDVACRCPDHQQWDHHARQVTPRASGT
jgi:hypothetical protein